MDEKLQETLKGVWDSLTDEQKEKAKACKTWDELTALAGKEGVELPDELLDAVAGGYIYHNGSMMHGGGVWETIRDSDGIVLARFGDAIDARKRAKAKGQSTMQIDTGKLQRIRKGSSSSGC